MQQMVGSAHDSMDAMMGGDSSYADQQMHIAIAENYYCNGDGTINGGYSSMMGGGYGMIGGYPGSGTIYSYRIPFMYYLPWILLALVAGSATAVILIVISKKSRSRRR